MGHVMLTSDMRTGHAAGCARAGSLGICSKRGWLLACSVALLLFLAPGCATQPRPAARTPAIETPTLAQLTQACALLAQRGLPCRASFSSEVWFILAHFETQAELDRHAGLLVKNLGAPFCRASLENHHRAMFVIELHSVGQRQLDCRSGSWSASVPPVPLPDLRALSVEQACRAINQSATIPLGCILQQANGMFKMTIAMQSTHDLDYYAKRLDDELIGRYCKSVIDAGAGGTVQLQAMVEKVGRVFNCETQVMSDWLQVQTSEPPPARQAPADRPTQDAPAQPPASARTKYL
jgi:hypothetical protein